MNSEEIKVNDEKSKNEVEVLDLGVDDSEFDVKESTGEEYADNN